jgi:MFS family permease
MLCVLRTQQAPKSICIELNIVSDSSTPLALFLLPLADMLTPKSSRSPGFVEISAELGISVNTLAQSTAWLILTIGLSLFIANPLAKVWGRRPIFIIAIAIMFAGSVWGAFAKNYDSFLASRVISGFGMAPYEVLVQCTIGDLYFVHQRATRIAAWNLFLLCGIAGGSLISGYIIQVRSSIIL